MHNDETHATLTIPVESIVNAVQECMYNQVKVRDIKTYIDDEILSVLVFAHIKEVWNIVKTYANITEVALTTETNPMNFDTLNFRGEIRITNTYSLHP